MFLNLQPQTCCYNNDYTAIQAQKSLVLNDKAVHFHVLSWYIGLKKKKSFCHSLKIPKLLTSEQSNHKKEFFLSQVCNVNRNTSHKQLFVFKSNCNHIVLVRNPFLAEQLLSLKFSEIVLILSALTPLPCSV